MTQSVAVLDLSSDVSLKGGELTEVDSGSWGLPITIGQLGVAHNNRKLLMDLLSVSVPKSVPHIQLQLSPPYHHALTFYKYYPLTMQNSTTMVYGIVMVNAMN